MKLLRFTSSNVQGGDYDPTSRKLTLAFGDVPDADDLSVYQYDGVPESIWRGLKDADSKGSFVGANIRPVFLDFQQIDDEITFVSQLHVSMSDWARSITTLEGANGWF